VLWISVILIVAGGEDDADPRFLAKNRGRHNVVEGSRGRGRLKGVVKGRKDFLLPERGGKRSFSIPIPLASRTGSGGKRME